MRSKVMVLVLGLMLVSTGQAAAQVGWDSPLLLPPQPPRGLGIFLTEPAGGDLGVMLTWRGRPSGLGWRIGVAEQPRFRDDDLAVFGGVDFARLLARASADFPLDAALVLGLGGSVGDDFLLSVPAGVTLGRTFTEEGVRFTPYVTPRIVLDAFFGDAADDLDLNLAIDLGLDLWLQPKWAVRFGVTAANDGREAIAIGIIF